MFAVASGLAFLAARAWVRWKRRRSLLAPGFEAVRQTLLLLIRKLPGQRASKEALALAVLTVKRYLSVQEGRDFSSLTPIELSQVARRTEAPHLLRILNLLSRTDSLRYQPCCPKEEQVRIITELLEAVESYHKDQELGGIE